MVAAITDDFKGIVEDDDRVDARDEDDFSDLQDPDADRRGEELVFPDDMQRAMSAAICQHDEFARVFAAGCSHKAFRWAAHRAIAAIALEHRATYGTPPTRGTVDYELRRRHKDDPNLLEFRAESATIFDYEVCAFDQAYLVDKIREFAKNYHILRGYKKYTDGLTKTGVPDESPVRESMATIDRMAPTDHARRGYLIRDLFELPPTTWLVAKHITEGGLSCVFGAYESGKTFFGLDMALSVATGRPFLGRYEVDTPAPVAYVVGEGYGGVRKRIWAWMHHHGVESIDNFVLIPAQFNMLDPSEAQAVMDKAEQQLGCLPKQIFMDTLTKMFGGGDSSNSRDMTAYVNNLQQIQTIGKQRGVVVGVCSIHHTGKDKSRGSLGSIVLPGACDSMIEIDGDVADRVHVSIHKQKDGSKISDYELVRRLVEIPEEIDPSGEGSLVLVARTGQFVALTDTQEAELLAHHRAFGFAPFSWAQSIDLQSPRRRERNASKLLAQLLEKSYLVDGGSTPYAIHPEAASVITRLETRDRASQEERVHDIVKPYSPTDEAD